MVRDLHGEAMGLVDDATARLREASRLEEAAALQAGDAEPSRSVLMRSAAWIALQAGDLRRAERLAAGGLAARDVPDRLRHELREVILAVHAAANR